MKLWDDDDSRHFDDGPPVVWIIFVIIWVLSLLNIVNQAIHLSH